MKLITKILVCMLFLSIQNIALAKNQKQSKELINAYNVLFNQQVKNKPAVQKQQIRKKRTTAKKLAPRSPQVNAVLVAKKQINKKYRWGGTNPYTGFDCSGLMQYAYKASRIHLPRTAAAQYKHTKRVSMNNLKVGDLIFFHTRRTRARVNHVGIYLGSGKFIHAPRRGKLVSIADLNGYWRKKAVGAGRV